MRIAVNDRRKDGDDWVDVAYYFNITAWGNLAERCAEWLTKGKKVGVTGKLTWREWESEAGKRQAVEVNAFQIEFLTPRSESQQTLETAGVAAPVFGGSKPADDDIPF
jgi:single-strand DNA-binding protein